MKRWKKIVLGVVIMLVIGIGGICIWQWNNIQALFVFVSQDSQQIANNVEEKRQEHQDAIQEKVPVTIMPPSTEQSDALLDQQATPDEIKDALGITDLLEQDRQRQEQEQGQSPPPQDGTPQPSEQAGSASQPPDQTGQSSQPPNQAGPTPQPTGGIGPASRPPDQAGQSSQPPNQAGSTPQPAELSQEELVNLCLAEMYACKIDLMAVLAQLKQEAVDEWNALPEAERTDTRKMEIGLAGLAKCYDLEAVVDDQVREILARYKGRLAAINGDLTIIDDLWQYYVEEKAAEKAYYIDKYMN